MTLQEKDLEKISTDIISKYYKGDFRGFLEYMDKDVLWIGPRQGLLRGRAAVEDAHESGNSCLTSCPGDMTVITEYLDPKIYSVMLFFDLTKHFTDGTIRICGRQIQMTWKERPVGHRLVPRIQIMQISSTGEKNKGATAGGQVETDAVCMLPLPYVNDLISFRTSRSSSNHMPASAVFWVGAAGKGKHCVFHTKEGDIPCIDPVSSVAEITDGILIRCHASYIVNPMYIREIRRFSVRMNDGTVLPIPEKKFTAFRAACDSWNEKIKRAEAEFIRRSGSRSADAD